MTKPTTAAATAIANSRRGDGRRCDRGVSDIGILP